MSRRSIATEAAAVMFSLLLAGCAGPPPAPAPDPAPAAQGPRVAAHKARAGSVEVDAGAELGTLVNPARYQNQADHSQQLTPNQERLVSELEPLVARAWITPRRYYDPRSNSYSFDYTSASGNSAYDYLDQVTRYAREVMVNMGECHQSLMRAAAGRDRCRDVLKAGVLHYKTRYPTLRYIEWFNEPDRTWDSPPGDPQPMTPAEYYDWYRIGYEIVNEVNAQLRPTIPLEIGGPVCYTFNKPYLRRFIELYAADPNPYKRLDFVAYHQYHARENPASVKPEKRIVRGWLADSGLDQNTPVFVTEYGVFPGDNTGTTFGDDLLTHAAAMATLGYYYVDGNIDMPMHWVLQHPSNERKSMLVRGDDHAVYPYFNVVKMQRMLKATRVAARSDSLSRKGLGVHALATKDGSGIAVLVTNYQWTTTGPNYSVSLTVRNLPEAFAGHRFRIERFLVDATTSNYAHDPARTELVRVENIEIDSAADVRHEFVLGRNAVSLVLLTPMS